MTNLDIAKIRNEFEIASDQHDLHAWAYEYGPKLMAEVERLRERVTIKRDDADRIRAVLEEFYHRHELSPEEERAFLSLCRAGNFGRPVRDHGSGPVSALAAPLPAERGVREALSPADPHTIIAGIRQFGLGPDGSDLRDLEAALSRSDQAGGQMDDAAPDMERITKVLRKMAEGWANVLDLNLIPPQHRTSAGILRDDARALLSEIEGASR
ncbi:MAG TPA: hypothetical protein VFT89_07220 [Rhizobiaceae bacterium]|nr:hypothetical protein [Rhizobiaceae bacterium]